MQDDICALKRKYLAQSASAILPNSITLYFIHTELATVTAIGNALLTPGNASAPRDHILLEKYKLALITQCWQIINKEAGSSNHLTLPLVNTPEPANNNYLSYYHYLFSGLLVNLVHGCVSSHALLALIPGIGGSMLMMTTAIFTILNGFSYYFYEGYILKKNLDIPILSESTEKYFNLFEQQLWLANAINAKLQNHLDVVKFNPISYIRLAQVATQINASVIQNQSRFREYQEGLWVKMGRLSIIAFGAVMAAGSAYFLVAKFLGMVAFGLLGGPVATALICVTVALAVNFYLGQRSHKVYKMVNPNLVKFTSLHKQFQLFNESCVTHNKIVLVAESRLRVDDRNLMTPLVTQRFKQRFVTKNLLSSTSSHRLFPAPLENATWRQSAPMLTSTDDNYHPHARGNAYKKTSLR